VLAGICLAWYISSRGSSSAGTIVGSVVGIGSVCIAILVVRSHLAVTDEGLVDCRAFRVSRLSWADIVEFGVDRPGGPWGGFCITATRHDGSTVDLLSTRAYSRIPSERHLDELYRMCWTLAEAASARRLEDR
jgi:hypothetical protein